MNSTQIKIEIFKLILKHNFKLENSKMKEKIVYDIKI